MDPCKLVKNPCKICLQKVTKSSGVQCSGGCRGWVHYKCLDYTPGKVKDIKAGDITIVCPCPDCRKQLPNEIYNKVAFTCTNEKCPANLPPKCIKEDCPANMCIGPKPLLPPTAPRLAQTMMSSGYANVVMPSGLSNNNSSTNVLQLCGGPKCGPKCKANLPTKNLFEQNHSTVTGCGKHCCSSQVKQPKPQMGCCDKFGATCGCSCKNKKNTSFMDETSQIGQQMSQTNSMSDDNKSSLMHSCSMPSFTNVEEMCAVVGDLAMQINILMSKMKQYKKMCS